MKSCSELVLCFRSDHQEAVGVLVNCPAYYNVSAAKAELLNKIKDMPEELREEEEQEDVNEKKVRWGGGDACSASPTGSQGPCHDRDYQPLRPGVGAHGPVPSIGSEHSQRSVSRRSRKATVALKHLERLSY